MVGLKIEDVKGFTSKLFVKEDFDLFLVKEVQIVTFNSFSIDGHIRKGYFSEEELEARRAKWQPREPKVTTGYLARYASMVTSGNRGAVLEIPGKKQD